MVRILPKPSFSTRLGATVFCLCLFFAATTRAQQEQAISEATEDSATFTQFDVSAGGKGAVYEWEGNSKAGKGRMEITDTSVPSRVVIKLDFLKPFEGHNISEFALDGKGNSTQVTWAMYGPNSFMAKMMSIFMSMDQLLGKEFENGLANLKAAAEK